MFGDRPDAEVARPHAIEHNHRIYPRRAGYTAKSAVWSAIVAVDSAENSRARDVPQRHFYRLHTAMTNSARKPATRTDVNGSQDRATSSRVSVPAERTPGAGGATHIVREHELMLATGYKTRTALARSLNINRIRYFTGRQGQIWTTRDLIQAAVSVGEPQEYEEDIEF